MDVLKMSRILILPIINGYHVNYKNKNIYKLQHKILFSINFYGKLCILLLYIKNDKFISKYQFDVEFFRFTCDFSFNTVKYIKQNFKKLK